MRKYSIGFERDYNFYLKSIGVFDFCGTAVPRFIGALGTMPTKEAFYRVDSGEKIYVVEERLNKLNMIENVNVVYCDDPELFNKLLLTKASVNFQIKQWAEAIAEGTMLLFELSNNLCDKQSGETGVYPMVLEWVDKEPVYYNDFEMLYGLPEWVVTAVWNQKNKFYKQAS